MLAECLKVCRDGFSLRGEVGVGMMQVPGRDFLWILYHKGLTAPDRCYYLNQAYLSMFIAGLKRGKTNRSQTATDVVMVIK